MRLTNQLSKRKSIRPTPDVIVLAEHMQTVLKNGANDEWSQVLKLKYAPLAYAKIVPNRQTIRALQFGYAFGYDVEWMFYKRRHTKGHVKIEGYACLVIDPRGRDIYSNIEEWQIEELRALTSATRYLQKHNQNSPSA